MFYKDHKSKQEKDFGGSGQKSYAFQKITNIVDVGFGHFAVDKILCNFGFRL